VPWKPLPVWQAAEMIFTEEELRQAWRNGSGELPEFPPGTRFTPAALDFLSALGRKPGQTGKPVQQALPWQALPVLAASGNRTESIHRLRRVPGGELVLQPLPDGKRLVITTCDLDDIWQPDRLRWWCTLVSR
jgi:hypothetical protein